MTGVFDHPWLRGLFGDAEAAAIWSPEAQLGHMLAFEAAYSRALEQAGLVDAATAEAAARAIETFEPDLADLEAGTMRDGLPVPALVRQLRARCGVDADAIHRGATSQDVLDTALALTLRATTTLLLSRLDALSDRLGALDAAFGARPLMGRTRMQAAMPITVSDRLAGWRGPLADHAERLRALRPRVERVQLGGAAGDRSELGEHGAAVAAHVAEALGLHDPPRAWHVMRDGVAEYAGALSLIAGTLGKMGQDICLMAQQGVDEIALAGGGGSSAMPHKANPVLAELLVTLARFGAVQVSGLHHALVHEQERSGTAWTLEWMILPGMARAAARSLSAAIRICDGVVRIGPSEQDL